MFYGAFISIGLYMLVLTKKWKVIVKNDKIMVYPLIKGEYSFICDEIVSMQRQVKKNRVKSERIVIKTNSKRNSLLKAHTHHILSLSRI